MKKSYKLNKTARVSVAKKRSTSGRLADDSVKVRYKDAELPATGRTSDVVADGVIAVISLLFGIFIGMKTETRA